ncbi:MAG: hypothetical protein V2B18_08720 [Pseudomonadota bacterium]
MSDSETQREGGLAVYQLPVLSCCVSLSLNATYLGYVCSAVEHGKEGGSAKLVFGLSLNGSRPGFSTKMAHPRKGVGHID